jgi:hypothetical protein
MNLQPNDATGLDKFAMVLALRMLKLLRIEDGDQVWKAMRLFPLAVRDDLRQFLEKQPSAEHGQSAN